MTEHFKNPRVADHGVEPLFTNRWSPRALTGEAVAESVVLTLLEAGRWAPSANNNQPWRFAYGVAGQPRFDAIKGALNPFNAAWAAKASAFIVVASSGQVERDGVVSDNPFASFDAGAAWAAIAYQGVLSGVVTHAMAGFDHDVLRANLGAAANGLTFHAVVAVGKPGDPATLPEGLRARETPSPRRPLADSLI